MIGVVIWTTLSYLFLQKIRSINNSVKTMNLCTNSDKIFWIHVALLVMELLCYLLALVGSLYSSLVKLKNNNSSSDSKERHIQIASQDISSSGHFVVLVVLLFKYYF